MPAKLTLTIDTSGFGMLGAVVRKQLGRVARATAKAVAQQAKDSITDGPKTGRIYGAETEVSFRSRDKDVSFVAHRGRELGDDKVHQASAPGEAPANDTGALASGINVEMEGDLTAAIIVPAEQGAALEFGRIDGTIAPRPFLGPALEAARPGFEADVAAVLRRGGK